MLSRHDPLIRMRNVKFPVLQAPALKFLRQNWADNLFTGAWGNGCFDDDQRPRLYMRSDRSDCTLEGRHIQGRPVALRITDIQIDVDNDHICALEIGGVGYSPQVPLLRNGLPGLLQGFIVVFKGK